MIKENLKIKENYLNSFDEVKKAHCAVIKHWNGNEDDKYLAIGFLVGVLDKIFLEG